MHESRVSLPAQCKPFSPCYSRQVTPPLPARKPKPEARITLVIYAAITTIDKVKL